MKFDITVHVHMVSMDDLNSIKHSLTHLTQIGETLMSTQAQLAADLQAVSAQIAKIGTESSATLQKVADLEAALAAAGNTTPEVDAALAALKTQVQVVDDLIPDAAPPAPPAA